MTRSLKDLPSISERANDQSGDIVKKIFKDAQLDPGEKISPPEIVFGIDDPRNGDVWVGSKGNVSLLKGPQKSRKTFALSAIAASIAGNTENIGFKSYLNQMGVVLYIDTEQGRYDCKKVQERMMSMSGQSGDNFKNQLTFLTLRPYSPRTRRDVIRYALQEMGQRLDILIVDGIRDLITDINDPTESTEIMTDLMAWSTDYNIHILNILHENKSDQKARGHLGTELQNKCESVFRVQKLDQDQEYSVIESVDMRGKEFDPIVFELMMNEKDVLLPLKSDVEVEKNEPKTSKNLNKSSSGKEAVKVADISNDVLIQGIRASFSNEMGMFDNINPLSAREFTRRMKKQMLEKSIKLSEHKARDLTEHLLTAKLLTDLNQNENTKDKKLVPGFDDELPF